ncbi:MAG: glycosyltransferase family 1 protein, partial [Deltaproteobacteria bacterium]|nr:glycosyltransferase family 1 protein [Deltaproteobacteria bacterium]
SRQVKNLRYFLGGVHRAWAGREVFMKDFASVIGTTKVFLGEDADITITGRYLSNRCFAVMGCGGFYLCRRTPGVEHAFAVGEELDVFDGDDEMVEKVRYYLAHDDERRRIAGAGQRRVLAEYTYEKQMKRIFDWVGTCREKGP